jgi:hypothetical protein
MRFRINNESLSALLILAFNTVYLNRILTLPAPFQQGEMEPGPAFYPLVLCIIMYVAGLRVLWKGLRKDEGLAVDLKNPRIFRPLGVTGATALFILLFEALGYWISNLLYTFLVGLIFEWGRKYGRKGTILFCMILALVITAAGWLFFDEFFDLHLPRGDIFQ